MPSAESIEDLVVTLGLDPAEYEAGLREAVDATKRTADEVGHAAEEVENFGKHMKEFGKGAIETLESYAILEFLKEAKNEWAIAETAAFKLSATIKGQGEDVQGLTKDYKEFAEQIEHTSTVSHVQVEQLLKTAEAFGVSGDKAKQTTSDALKLAAITDVSAQAAIRLTEAYAKGDAEGFMRFKRMIPELRTVKDQSEALAKYEQLVTTGAEIMGGEVDTVAGKAKVFQNKWTATLEEVGRMFSEIANPVKMVKKFLMELWGGMDEGTKKTVVLTATLVAGFLAVAGAITVAGTVFNTMFGGVGIIIGLIVTGAAAIAAWASEAGGAKAAWDSIKKSIKEAWDSTKQIRQALQSYFETLGEVLSNIWDSIKTEAEDVWNSISVSAGVNWKEVRDTIRDAILMAEFNIRHFEDLLDLTWLGIKLQSIQAASYFKQFGDSAVAIGEFIYRSYVATFTQLHKLSTTVFKNMFSNIANIANNFTDLVRGKVQFKDLWKDLREGFVQIEKPELVLPARVVTELEKQWEKEFTESAAKYFLSWLEFRAKKLAEFNKEIAKDADKEVGPSMDRNFKKPIQEAYAELKKLDAALKGSAESIGRLADYQDLISRSGPGKKGGYTMNKTSGAPNAGVAEDEFGEEIASNTGRQLDVLNRIDSNIAIVANKPSVELASADI